ncbi:MAG TPA: VCBS repeat-containing protein, partial [Phycisphaerae bacterium]|nr:VCBS repeat-containing protein [Phycisphaerae bacterium]
MIGRSVIACVLVASAAHAADLLKFERQRIGDATFEAASVCDVNRDGKPDIVSGEYWFEGPAFTRAHKIYDIPRVEDYYDDFSDFPMDVNGDGYPDIITGGWWGQTLRWRENPQGRDIPWKTHDIDKCGPIETSRFWDVDGDGQLEIVPNAGGRVAWYKLVRDADGKGTGRFEKHVVKPDGC